MTAAVIGSLLITVAAILATGFIIDYARLSKGQWRRDPIGRHLMVYVMVDAAVLLLGAVRFAGGAGLDTGWFAWIRVVVFVGVPWTIGWRWLILRRLYRRDRNAP